MARRRTEDLHPSAAGLQDLPLHDVLGRLHSAQIAAAAAVVPAFPALETAARAAARALRDGQRMVYVGAGSSGLMALADCLELLGTFGIPPQRTPMLFAGGADALLTMTGAVEDDPALAAADLAGLEPQPGDVLLCLSASGSTPYTLAVAAGAKARGAVIAGLANVEGSALLSLADIPILLDTGPEVVAGSTRMGAGTAQKIALNMLSVLVGLQLGHVHEGYMVNVIADNAKLADRAARIVAALSGATQVQAAAALTLAGGAVKPATLIAAGATPEAAQTALETHHGHLGPALAALKTN
jgi:N-acetylmuramic acid 6-phosphate etherase